MSNNCLLCTGCISHVASWEVKIQSDLEPAFSKCADPDKNSPFPNEAINTEKLEQQQKNTPLRFNLVAKIRPRTWLSPCCFRGLRMDPLSGGMGTEKGRGARFRSEDLAMAASLWGRREANRPAVWGRHEECYCWATQKALNLCACQPLDLPDHFLNQFCGWTVVSTWESNPHFPSYWWSSEFGFPFW